MAGAQTGRDSAISASWERCQKRYRLARDTARPILRLQSAEIAPRFEQVAERIGGRRGIFRQLAGIAVEAGHCLAVADTEGILVRLEDGETGRSPFESHGIALGSCWDERIAGTSGVSMALAQGEAFTVAGQEHYFLKLSPFSCTAVPLLDAENRVVAVVALGTVDRGNASDRLFARQLLEAAADRIQRILFESRFVDSLIVRVSRADHGNFLRNNELVAVDGDGIILGSSARACDLVGMDDPSNLVDRSFQDVFGAEAMTLDRFPERVLSTRAKHGALLHLALGPRMQAHKGAPGRGWRPATAQRPRRRRLAPSLRELAVGSEVMASICERAMAHFERALSFVIEGASGTGKSALIGAIGSAAGVPPAQIVTIDCAMQGKGAGKPDHIRALFEQARVLGALEETETGPTMLVFDNCDELPDYAQAALRTLLSDMESFDDDPDGAAHGLRLIATARAPLVSAVESGHFRDDLYYLLANARLHLPPLRERERLDRLALALAERLAGRPVDISTEAVEAIVSHEWPGNVRELRAALRQALIDGDGRRISLIDLRNSPGVCATPSPGSRSAARTMPAAYDERTLLLDALAGARWNVSQAARALGLGRATIHRKMKRQGISRPT